MWASLSTGTKAAIIYGILKSALKHVLYHSGLRSSQRWAPGKKLPAPSADFTYGRPHLRWLRTPVVKREKWHAGKNENMQGPNSNLKESLPTHGKKIVPDAHTWVRRHLCAPVCCNCVNTGAAAHPLLQLTFQREDQVNVRFLLL